MKLTSLSSAGPRRPPGCSRAFSLLVGGALLTLGGSLRAQTTYTYIGPATSGLDTGSNWSNGTTTGTVPGSGDTATFNGSVSGALSLSEATANAFGGTTGATINLTSAQTGSVTITGSSIRLAGLTSASGATANSISFQGTVIFGGGTAAPTYTVTNNSAGAVTFAAATAIAPGGSGVRTLDFEGTGNVNITGAIASTSLIAFQKGTAGSTASSGNLTLAGANGYSAGTTVNAGTLTVRNTSGSATGTGAVAINAGGTLTGGSGAANGGASSTLGSGGNVATYKTYNSGILGLVTGPVTVASGGRLTPGSSATGVATVGTLTLGALTLNAGSTATYEFSTTNATNSFTAVTGALTLAGTAASPTAITLYQDGTTNPFAAVGTYNLLGYSSLASAFNAAVLSVANPQAGFNYAFVNDAADSLVQLNITAVPEPSSWVAGGLCLAVVAAGAWRRQLA